MRKKGFTLLELIIVIVILGILASFALPRYFRVAERGRSAEAVSVLGTLRSAQMRARAERGVYQGLCANLDVDITPPRFFNAPTCIAAADDLVNLVTIVRNNAVIPNSIVATEAYTLAINGNGVINCTTGAVSCPALGY